MAHAIRLALLLPLALAGCAERKYPWPDMAVDESAWTPANPVVSAPLAVPAATPAAAVPSPARPIFHAGVSQ